MLVCSLSNVARSFPGNFIRPKDTIRLSLDITWAESKGRAAARHLHRGPTHRATVSFASLAVMDAGLYVSIYIVPLVDDPSCLTKSSRSWDPTAFTGPVWKASPCLRTPCSSQSSPLRPRHSDVTAACHDSCRLGGRHLLGSIGHWSNINRLACVATFVS